jgi:rod shape-determining protein MreC
MSKKWVISTLFLVSLFAVYYFFGSILQRQIAPISVGARSMYLNVSEYLADLFFVHTYQAQTISTLKKENEKLQKEALLYKTSIRDTVYRQGVQGFILFDTNQTAKVKLSKTLSYSNLPNLYRVWIDFEPSIETEKSPAPKVYGVIYPTQNKLDSVACGIALKNQNGKFEAFLNGDPKCSYGVYVGKSRAPGVVYGKNQDKLVVKYIPTWMDVKVGDEVVTSGLDNIFFEGVRVGIVKSVNSDSAYKEVQVDGYYNPLSPNYFYVIEKAK